jgi:hypothetical protein
MNSSLPSTLPLTIPPDCALRVGEETHIWEPGRRSGGLMSFYGEDADLGEL